MLLKLRSLNYAFLFRIYAKIAQNNKHVLEKHLSENGIDEYAKVRICKGRTITKLVERTVDSDVSLIGKHTCINIPLAFKKMYMRLKYTRICSNQFK